jgi:hypothetical protein
VWRHVAVWMRSGRAWCCEPADNFDLSVLRHHGLLLHVARMLLAAETEGYEARQFEQLSCRRSVWTL